ncbi:MAG: class I SAM-dependent methyltransferase [Campylobacterales bacterium]|nr:class I SAM-dependent methyltransferase [Campylobacterales bacterium]
MNNSIENYKLFDYEKFKNYDRFKFLVSMMEQKLNDSDTLLDIGCAKAELIYCLKEKFPHIQYTGLEFSQDLIDMASSQSFLKDVKLIQGDAQNFNINKKFDIVVMSGVLSIFDEIEVVLTNFISHLTNKGKGYIFGMFNSNDIDVLIKFRNNYINSNQWETGLNNFSINTVDSYLKQYFSIIKWTKFDLSVDLPKTENPINSYTLNCNEGKVITNGTGLITDFYLIELEF